MIHAAKNHQAKVVLADNIYAYGKVSDEPVNEDAEKMPHTKKGKIRLEMENQLKNSGVPTLIVHLPDLYGPNANNTLLHETLKNVRLNKSANFVGSLQPAREFMFTLDAALAVVELAFREDAYDQNWNVPSARPISGEEIIAILREEAGYDKSVRAVSKSMIRFMGIFQPFMRELVEMMYLTEDPVWLDGGKYESEIGKVPKTPYKEGIIKTLDWMNEQQFSNSL